MNEPLELDTRFPGSEDIEDPDTSETYPVGYGDDEADGAEANPFTDEVVAALRSAGFNVDRLRKAWGTGDKLNS